MSQPVFFSPRVLNTLNALPFEDRTTVAAALTSEFLLDTDVSSNLSGVQKMVYAILSRYVRQDMSRFSCVQTVHELRDIC